MTIYHIDGTLPVDKDWVFVFGSNRAGRHGKGAALVAMQEFGAEYGVGSGPMGNCYAIPTKDKYLNVLSLPSIEQYVRAFQKYAEENSKKKFFITRIGCDLAGYKNSQIAPMFLPVLPNCSYPQPWQRFL